MKTIKNIFAQEKRIIDAINKEGQTLINTTSFEEWDNIEDRLEQIIKRRRRVFNIARALRDQEHARMDCIDGIYDKFYRYNRTDDGQAYDKAWQAQNQITRNETVTFLYTE
jgi:hypothetical protein